ncbi:Quinidine resistance protein 1 [Lasiodiplodia hormozganensis]|uniref:Quinidine resistance protein 1 n=1 Tax=Lasiodiplodia hormozganensis TaxID=869390 RepID=A0AA39YD07_9PEZI|nr:Quinidine resistance protein 1 [Lasiodiplodia hormozganensis]
MTSPVGHETLETAVATNTADELKISAFSDGTDDQRGEKKLESEQHVIHASPASSRRPSTSNGPEQEIAQDLERASTAASGPVYSVFPRKMKLFIVFMVAWGGFFSPLSANIFYPALNTLSSELHVSVELINLTLTTYSIFQGLAPTIFGDLADMAGRRPAYIIGFIIYIGACIGIALQDSYAALMVLRCLQSTGSSGMIALANGVVADVATVAERGTWMGWATGPMMIGPAAGPVIGGLLAQFLGWRAIFWFLVIMAGVYLIIFTITCPETGRNVVGNGSIPPQGWNMSVLNWLSVRKAAKKDNSISRTVSRESNRIAQQRLARSRKLRWPNPLNTMKLIREPDVGLLLFYNSLVYTAFMDVAASAPFLFTATYSLNDLQIGLSFIPFGFGALLAPLVNGRLLDWNYRRTAARIGMTIDRKRGDDLRSFPIERARIEVAAPLLAVGLASLTAYGWVMDAETRLAAPLVLFFLIGLTLTGTFNVLNLMLVDFYPLSPATATAANNLVRCLMGAGGSAVVILMIKKMGRGWCFTFHALVVLAASPILWVLIKKGPGWREKRRVKAEEVRRRKEEKEEERERARMEEDRARNEDSKEATHEEEEK